MDINRRTGFAREYVQLAQALARGGLLAIAACWFEGGGGPGARFVTPIACPDAPALTALRKHRHGFGGPLARLPSARGLNR